MADERLELVPSTTNETGFKGVTKRRGRLARPYEAYVCEKGSNRTLGSFATPTEAAQCFTRYIGPEQAAIAAANAKIGLPRFRALTAEEARTAAEREGLELLLSTTNGTGFKGVTKRRGRLARPYEAQIWVKGMMGPIQISHPSHTGYWSYLACLWRQYRLAR